MPISSDPEKRAKQIAQLKPNGGGTGGRKKGSRNWSTVTRQILDDPILFQKLVNGMVKKPVWLRDANPETLMDAITISQGLKALAGGNGSQASAEWIRKTGFGDKIDITSNGETLKTEPVVVSSIKPRNVIEGEIVSPEQATGFTNTESTDESTAEAETETSS